MKWLRFIGRVMLALFLLILAAIGAFWINGNRKFHLRPSNPVPAWTAARDSAHVARGRHISELVCMQCHGDNTTQALSGGPDNFGQIPSGPHLGELYAPNLTPGSHLARVSDGALARAIREGVGHDGGVLIVMPAAFHSMSDEDLSGVVAYLRSEPAVHAAVRPRSMNALGLILLGAGVFDTSLQPPVRGVIPEVREDSTAQYGGYLINLMACRDCHGKDLLGAPSSSLAPHGPNLVALVAAHPSGVFSQALRGGIGSDGRRLDPLKMPWNVFSRLSDVETVALYRYLKSLGGSR